MLDAIERLELFYLTMLEGMRKLPEPKTMASVAREFGFRGDKFEFWREGRQLPTKGLTKRLAVACGVSQRRLLRCRDVTKDAHEQMKAARKPQKSAYKANPDCDVFIGQGRTHRSGSRSTSSSSV